MKEEAHPDIVPRDAPRYLVSILDTIPDAVFVKDLAGRHIYMNRAAIAALGHRRPEDVIGRTGHEVQPKEIADHFERHDEQIRRTRETVSNGSLSPGRHGVE